MCVCEGRVMVMVMVVCIGGCVNEVCMEVTGKGMVTDQFGYKPIRPQSSSATNQFGHSVILLDQM